MSLTPGVGQGINIPETEEVDGSTMQRRELIVKFPVGSKTVTFDIRDEGDFELFRKALFIQ